MSSVPGVETDILVQTHYTQFRVFKRTCELLRGKRSQQQDPTPMQRFQEGKGYLYGRISRVAQFSPPVFMVRFDGRLVLCQGQFEPGIAIEMAVWQVMYDLSDCPSSRPIRGVKLFK
jgi:hypothetical protein